MVEVLMGGDGKSCGDVLVLLLERRERFDEEDELEDDLVLFDVEERKRA